MLEGRGVLCTWQCHESIVMVTYSNEDVTAQVLAWASNPRKYPKCLPGLIQPSLKPLPLQLTPVVYM